MSKRQCWAMSLALVALLGACADSASGGHCGDGYCAPGEMWPGAWCGLDCSVGCGDGVCTEGESCTLDCGAGRDAGSATGDAGHTPRDAGTNGPGGPLCGDGACESPEQSSCPADCGGCGDGLCQLDELYGCVRDCGEHFCGDGVCDYGETWAGCAFDCDTGDGLAPGDVLGPDEAVDFFVITVSGHCLGAECGGHNDEYLWSEGTVDRVFNVLDDAGYLTMGNPYADSFYDYDYSGRDYTPPDGYYTADERGFLGLLRDLAQIRDYYVHASTVSTRIIMMCHSHGCVWAHLALLLMPDVPVDVLISLDGESYGWRGAPEDLGGDNWTSVIRHWESTYDVMWPLGDRVADPADAFDIPGVTAFQDAEDVVPNNVALNLEVSGSTFPTAFIHDGDPNHRLDGSTRGIVSISVDEGHSELDDPYSETMDWVVEELAGRYPR